MKKVKKVESVQKSVKNGFIYLGDEETMLYGYSFKPGEVVSVSDDIADRLRRNTAYEAA